jgi:hypothetical protein
MYVREGVCQFAVCWRIGVLWACVASVGMQDKMELPTQQLCLNREAAVVVTFLVFVAVITRDGAIASLSRI